jgi:exonuclease SbcD
MRLLHGADLHLGVSRYGADRLADFRSTLGRMADSARESKADAILLAGDTFDTRRAGPGELAVLTEFLASLDIPKVIIPGDHDGMTVIGDPATHALLWLSKARLPNLYVLFQPGWQSIATASGTLNVFALPRPHKRAFDTEFAAAGVPVDERTSLVGQRVENIITTLADDRPLGNQNSGPTVFVGHIPTIGAKLGSEAALKLGADVAIRAELLNRFDYAALGHMHRYQQVSARAFYSGSVEYLDFGDLGTRKGWIIADVNPGEEPRTSFVESGCRPMVELTVEQADDGRLVPSGLLTSTPGTSLSAAMAAAPIVRLTVHATHERPRAARLAETHSKLRSLGASFIKTEVRLDLPEVRATVTVDPEADTADALASWLTAKGLPMEPVLSMGRELIAALGE